MQGKSQSIKVRKRHYPYDEAVSNDYDSGNKVLTAEWDALALIIPPGERYFIRSVRKVLPRAQDPTLKSQIKAFLGQETMHAQETDRSLELLEKRGFPVKEFENWQEKMIRRIERLAPFPKCHLAGTAAVEHFTDVNSVWHLSTRWCDRFPPSLRDYWQWHGGEELEHKAVAYDLLMELSPYNYPRRAFCFLVAIGATYFIYRRALRKLLKFSGLSRREIRQERKRARKIRIPLFSLRFPQLLSYLRPGFHPSQIRDGGIGEKILAEQAARAGARPA